MTEKIFEAVSEEARDFSFNIRPRNWFERMLKKLGLFKAKRAVSISPIKFGTRAQFSKHAIKLNVQAIGKGSSVTRTGLLIADNHMEDLTMALAIAIHNDPFSKPPKWLQRELLGITQSELDVLIAILLKNQDVQSFLNSIILINGMSLQTEEIIAPEKENRESTK